MAQFACVNCRWMCNERDGICNMCGAHPRFGFPKPPPPNPFVACASCGWVSTGGQILCECCGKPWHGVPTQSAGLPLPVAISSSSRPDPSMLTGQPPPPPPPPPLDSRGLPVLGRLLLNRPTPESELADNPRLMCIDCREIVGNRPRTCPRCGLAPDQDSLYVRTAVKRLDQAFSRCQEVGAWTTLKSPYEPVWIREKRLIDVLRDCLTFDGGQCVDATDDGIVARMEIRGETTCALVIEPIRGRVRIGGPQHEIASIYRLVPLKEPRRIFRWLTWVGLKGVEQYTT